MCIVLCVTPYKVQSLRQSDLTWIHFLISELIFDDKSDDIDFIIHPKFEIKEF